MLKSSDNHPMVSPNHPIPWAGTWLMESADNHPTNPNFHPIIKATNRELSGNRQLFFDNRQPAEVTTRGQV